MLKRFTVLFVLVAMIVGVFSVATAQDAVKVGPHHPAYYGSWRTDLRCQQRYTRLYRHQQRWYLQWF